MFTLTDIRNIAIQIERNGEAAYRNACEGASQPDLAKMLCWMADEELRHIDWFKALEFNLPDEPVNQEMERMGNALLQEMMQQQTFSLDHDRLEQTDTIQALLSQSLTFEQDTILFYEMLGAFIDDTEVHDQLSVIIEEERKHVAQIERMQCGFAE